MSVGISRVKREPFLVLFLSTHSGSDFAPPARPQKATLSINLLQWVFAWLGCRWLLLLHSNHLSFADKLEIIYNHTDTAVDVFDLHEFERSIQT